MTLLLRIENIMKLWSLMLPEILHPSPAWIGRWCAFTDEALEQGIVRASKKFSPQRLHNVSPDAETVWRYVGGVAANESKNATQQHQPLPKTT